MTLEKIIDIAKTDGADFGNGIIGGFVILSAATIAVGATMIAGVAKLTLSIKESISE